MGSPFSESVRLDLGLCDDESTLPPPNLLSSRARPRRRLRLPQLLLTLLLVLLSLPSSLSVTLILGTQPSLAIGGEPFGVQPVVNFLDDGGNLDSTFSGFAYATIQESLTGFESLYYAGSSTNIDNMVAVVDGRATFSGLTLNEAGSGYKLRFIGLDSSNTPFAYADSQSFAVVAGPAHQISIARHPASATGGSSFRTQPVVNMEDRGGNVLTTFSGEIMTLMLFAPRASVLTLKRNSLRWLHNTQDLKPSQ